MTSVMRASSVMLAFSVILMSIACATAKKNNKKKYLDASFDYLDANKDGKISYHELQQFYKKAGLNDHQIDFMFYQADANDDKGIDKEEFDQSFSDKQFPQGEKDQFLHSYFQAIDNDGDGYFNLEDTFKFYQKLGLPYPKDFLEQQFNKMDKNGDGQISFEEYSKFSYEDYED